MIAKSFREVFSGGGTTIQKIVRAGDPKLSEIALPALSKSIDLILGDGELNAAAVLKHLCKSGEEFVDYVVKDCGVGRADAHTIFENTVRDAFQKRAPSAAGQRQELDKMDDLSRVNKLGVSTLMHFEAEKIRKAEPHLTREQAFAKYMRTPEGSKAYQIYKRAPEPPSNVISMRHEVRKSAPGPACVAIESQAEQIRKANPRLSPQQAYARTFKDRNNADLRKRALAESMRGEPLDAA